MSRARGEGVEKGPKWPRNPFGVDQLTACKHLNLYYLLDC